jgi:hypothetical protein
MNCLGEQTGSETEIARSSVSGTAWDGGGEAAGGVTSAPADGGTVAAGGVAGAPADRGPPIAGGVAGAPADRGEKAAGGVAVAPADGGVVGLYAVPIGAGSASADHATRYRRRDDIATITADHVRCACSARREPPANDVVDPQREGSVIGRAQIVFCGICARVAGQSPEVASAKRLAGYATVGIDDAHGVARGASACDPLLDCAGDDMELTANQCQPEAR